MIGLPSTTPAGPAAGLPMAAAVAAPPAGLAAADQAFDDVFRQLTGGLLTTSAQAGEAMAAEGEARVEGEEGGSEAAFDGLPFVVPVPAAFTLPPVVTLPAETVGEGGDAVDTTLADGAVIATTGPVGAVPAPAPAPAEGDAFDEVFDTEAEADPALLAALTLPARNAGTETPATEVEAHVRGLDRRRGMRETPARARTFAEEATPAPAPAPSPEAAAGTPAPAPAASAAPREMPAGSERHFALQQALARQLESSPRDGVAPGLAAQAAQAMPAAAGSTGGGDDAAQGRRQGRAWAGGVVPPAPGPAAAATEVAAGAEAAQEAPGPGPAASAAWRAALASSALADALGASTEGPRQPGVPGHVTGLAPAVELAAIRDRAPILVDAPVALPELDAATADSVHTQIVRSIRMQWTGGVSEARVTLRPEYLGEVTASIKVEQGVVTATLQADTPEVRRWMESHTATLRDALVDHGLKLDRLTVGEPERQPAQGDRQAKPRQQPRPQTPRPRARRESDADTPFEVTTD